MLPKWPIAINSKFAKTFKSNALKPMNETESKLPTGEKLLFERHESITGIFMHVHKCAGTSFITAISNCPELISVVARPGNFPMRTGMERVPENIWRNSFKFTFVRNPYARLVSAYAMFTRSPKWRDLFPDFSTFLNFLRWVDIDYHTVEGEVDMKVFLTSLDNIIHHVSSYHNSKYRLNEMDYIGKVEELSDGLKNIQKATSANISLPHLNRSNNSKDYRDYYDSRARHIASQIYAKDIERFGYAF